MSKLQIGATYTYIYKECKIGTKKVPASTVQFIVTGYDDISGRYDILFENGAANAFYENSPMANGCKLIEGIE